MNGRSRNKSFRSHNTGIQCCGSGSGSRSKSVSFWASRIQIIHYLHGSRSGSGSESFYHPEKSKKSLNFYCFVTSLWLFILEDWCKCSPKSNRYKHYFLLASWKEQVRTRFHKSVTRIRGSGPVPKCHGSTTVQYDPHPLTCSWETFRRLSWRPTSSCRRRRPSPRLSGPAGRSPARAPRTATGRPASGTCYVHKLLYVDRSLNLCCGSASVCRIRIRNYLI
jgi:hypothetical protein